MKPERDRCDHKFIDSNHCLKCGWSPEPRDDIYQGQRHSGDRTHFVGDDCPKEEVSGDAPRRESVRPPQDRVGVLRGAPSAGDSGRSGGLSPSPLAGDCATCKQQEREEYDKPVVLSPQACYCCRENGCQGGCRCAHTC